LQVSDYWQRPCCIVQPAHCNKAVFSGGRFGARGVTEPMVG
jgi:hypothetical protein